MRIVGGTWRGRQIVAPEGRGTRPTTDRMRETIASMVLSACDLDLSGMRVLDAFAGSGGVGLELLSRGAAHCTFCERDGRAAALVRRNCEALGADKRSWDIVRGDVRRLAERGLPQGGRLEIVFLDPPYAMPAEEVSALVGGLVEAGLLGAGCVIVYERAASAPELRLDGLTLVRSRTHGGTSVDVMVWAGEAASS